jgi:hypothetical protein
MHEELTPSRKGNHELVSRIQFLLKDKQVEKLSQESMKEKLHALESQVANDGEEKKRLMNALMKLQVENESMKLGKISPTSTPREMFDIPIDEQLGKEVRTRIRLESENRKLRAELTDLKANVR